MLSKHHRAYDPSETSAAKRLRLNVSDLFQSNAVTGKRTQELINDAAAAGVDDCTPWKKRNTSNTARYLGTAMLENIQWPKFYEVEVACKNPRTNKTVKQKVKVMLPSEVLSAIHSRSDPDLLYSRKDMDPKTLEHLEKCEAEVGQKLIALGLWGDGAPCNWDRTESIEVFSWNILGLPGQHCITCCTHDIYIYICIYIYIYTNCILNVYMTHPGKQRSMRMLYIGISKKMRA